MRCPACHAMPACDAMHALPCSVCVLSVCLCGGGAPAVKRLAASPTAWGALVRALTHRVPPPPAPPCAAPACSVPAQIKYSFDYFVKALSKNVSQSCSWIELELLA